MSFIRPKTLLCTQCHDGPLLSPVQCNAALPVFPHFRRRPQPLTHSRGQRWCSQYDIAFAIHIIYAVANSSRPQNMRVHSSALLFSLSLDIRGGSDIEVQDVGEQ